MTTAQALLTTAPDWQTTGQGLPLRSRTTGRRELCALFARLGFRRGAEIGVWTGLFSKAICQAVPGVSLWCVDPWQARADYHERKNDGGRLQSAFEEARARLRPFDCTLLRMTSIEATEFVLDQSLDFVYIDGNHERPFVLSDLAAWTPKVRPGGIVAGHDFHEPEGNPFIQVVPAVREFTRQHRIDPWFVLAADKAPSYCWVVS